MKESELVRLVKKLDTGENILYFQDENALVLLQKILNKKVACKLIKQIKQNSAVVV